VVGHGQTLQKALTSLRAQLNLGPQQLEQEHDDELMPDSDAQKATTDQESTAYVRKYDLRSNTQDKSKLTALPSPRGPAASSGTPALTLLAPPNPQLPKPVFNFQPWNLSQTTSPFQGYPTTVANDALPNTAIANPFLTGLKIETRHHFQPSVSLTPNSIAPSGTATTNKPGPANWTNCVTHAPLSFQSCPLQNPLSSILDKSSLQEAREKQKRKEADMESGEDEEDWDRRDTQKQARKKAKILPARQVSSPFFSFASTAPVSRPASLQPSAVPFSFDVQQRVHAFPFPNTHASASFNPFQPMPSISCSPNLGSLSPDELSREPYDRAIHNFSSFPVRQDPRNEIKVEEIVHEVPKKIKVEETSGIPES
jgi:hypothetical protein